MKYAVVLILCLILSGCGLDNSYFLYRNFEKGREMTTTIGSPMTEQKVEYKNNVYGTIIQSAQHELIYSGKSGNVIKIVYREFSNDLARPAFTQEIQYDLNESMTVKFKNTTIEVIRATNQEITFRVIDAPTFKYKPGKLTREEVQQMQEKK